MKENIYDHPGFFEKYSQFPRSVKGLNAAGEWHELKRILPDFKGKHVLDLGCGFGWHCEYAAEQGAASITGIDISKKMLERAKNSSKYNNIAYICSPIEDYEYPDHCFDIVLSSLAFHYIASFDQVCRSVFKSMKQSGHFVFSVEHPIFTSQGKQDWIYDESGAPLFWPVDSYFSEGIRNAVFLGEQVQKYHKTMATYIQAILQTGFTIAEVCEPKPTDEMMKQNAMMAHEIRRPMMLIISATK